MSDFRRIDLARCVKVCGLVRDEDVDAAAAAGADLFGFIAPGVASLRAVAVERLSSLAARAPRGRAVLVVADMAAPAAIECALRGGFSALQVCGPADADAYAESPLPILRASSVEHADRFELWERHVWGFVFEPVGAVGGSGRLADLRAVERVAAGRLGLLAGGLDGSNVEQRLALLPPLGVDASSRLERSPGEKDAARIAAFVAAARRAFARRMGEVHPCS